MIRDSDRKFLHKVTLFQNLSPERQEAIFMRMVTTAHPKGTIIFKQGDVADALYIVRKGMLEIFRSESPQDYDDIRLCSLKTGECCGEFSLIGSTKRLTTAMTGQETHLLHLTRQDFDELAKKDPELGLQLIRSIADNLLQPFQKNPEFFFQAIRMI